MKPPKIPISKKGLPENLGAQGNLSSLTAIAKAL
jgi:hypothetical protein